MIQPTAYASSTLTARTGASVVLTNVLTGESITVNGTSIRCWKGRKGITVQGYDERTGKYTTTVRHLSTDTTKFVGVIVGSQFLSANLYTDTYRAVREVFGQNV